LGAGEIGFESDTNKFKIGTGSTAWVSLPYASNVSPLTTKGDLYTYSTDNARLAVGNNGETLVADSSTSTGLRYQGSMAAGKNLFINGGFDIWQRGITFSIGASSGTYTADRYLGYRSSAVTGMTVSRSTDAPTGFTYSAKVQRDSGVITTNNLNFRQAIESQQSKYLAGKTVVVSFYAKAGANYSSASNALLATLYSGTGTDQSPGAMTTWTGVTNVVNTTFNITASWVRYSMTGTLASTVNQIGITFANTPVGTAGADDSYFITGLQIEEGAVATPFTMSGGTLQGEIAACQRYYVRYTVTSTIPIGVTGGSLTTTIAQSQFQMPVKMRTTPSAVDSANIDLLNYTTNTAFNGGTLTIPAGNEDTVMVRYTHGSAVLTAGQVTGFRGQSSVTSFIGLNAEL
jgi:hypothetical protein